MTAGDPLYDLGPSCGYYRMYTDAATATRDRLLAHAAIGLSPDRQQALTAYLIVAALLSHDLYPEARPIHDTGHYRWARDILANAAYWPST